MKKGISTVLSIILVFMLVISLPACKKEGGDDTTIDESTTSSEEGTSENEGEYVYEKPEENVIVEVFAMPINGSGIQNDPIAEYMKQEFGIIVDWLPAAGDVGLQKISAMMAAGSLPDVVIFKETQLAQDAIKANLLIDLGTKLDMLPNVVKNASKSLEYFSDTIGGGKKYCVGEGISNSIYQDQTNWVLSIRWDLYKQVGLPEVNTMDDLIPLLKDMQELEPETPDGKKVYGMSFWPDWDGAYIFMPTEYMGLYGAEIRPGYTEYYAETEETKNALADDSMYHEALKWFFKVNQAGLLDPDSLSQRFDNARSKYEAGRAILAFHNWVSIAYNGVEGHQEAIKGFTNIYPKDVKILFDQSKATGKYPTAISEDSKKEEYALKFLDFFYTTDFCSMASNGLEGENWKMVNGRPELTDLGWERVDSGEHAKTYKFYSQRGLAGTVYDESKGEPIHFNYWKSTKERPEGNLLLKDYYETMNITQTLDLLDKDKNIVIRQAHALVPPFDDDTNAIVSKISPIVKEYSWKMVFAEDEEEFNSLWNQMQEKAEGLGLQKVLQAGEEATQVYYEKQEKYGDKTIINFNK